MSEGVVSEGVKSAVQAFMHLVAVVETMSGELWQAHQLTLTQARCLGLLQGGPVAAGVLAHKLGLSAASLTRVVERLEARGLVERQVDRQDRRRVTVTLSDGGREIVGGLRLWMTSPIVGVIAAMSEEKRALLTDMLEELAQEMRRAAGTMAGHAGREA
jgi:DNA-binding MarR family transcriptional regulator